VSVALDIQTAKRMRRFILSPVACPALPYFPTLSHKRCECRWGGGGGRREEEALLNIKCVFWYSVQLSSEAFLTICRIQRNVFINVYWYSSIVPITVRFLIKFYWEIFRKNPQISNSTNICLARVELFPCRQRHMTKLIVTFRNFTRSRYVHTGTHSSFPLREAYKFITHFILRTIPI
jgi:hypothetical protein